MQLKYVLVVQNHSSSIAVDLRKGIGIFDILNV